MRIHLDETELIITPENDEDREILADLMSRRFIGIAFESNGYFYKIECVPLSPVSK